MRIVAEKNLRAFAEANPICHAAIQHFVVVVRLAEWQAAAEVLERFPKAKVVTGERVRFAIAGGKYRLIVAFSWRHQIAFVKFIGSHAEYDRIDAATVSQF